MICATTVGTFVPTLVSGTPLFPGLCFGRLQRLGRWHDLLVPPGIDGYAEQPLPRFSPVEHGTPLLRVRPRSGRRREKVKAAVKSMIHGGRAVRAELEGTLYHRPAPGAQPFVAEGSHVSAEDTIAVVEVMKTFTRIRAPFPGILRRWLVHDGGTVLLGTPLVIIDPEPSAAAWDGLGAARGDRRAG
jgi:biotin carboxyl carrier protein